MTGVYFFRLCAYDRFMTKKKCPSEQVKGLIRFHCCNDTFMTENKCFCVKGERVILSLQLNSCQAKDKPPRPLRSERSRKADGTASSRIACQESTFWQCRQQIQFDVTLFKAYKLLIIRPLSDKTNEGE